MNEHPNDPYRTKTTARTNMRGVPPAPREQPGFRVEGLPDLRAARIDADTTAPTNTSPSGWMAKAARDARVERSVRRGTKGLRDGEVRTGLVL
ncbi:MAG TPA: hypothetical protein VG370_03210 [Chloroflexota bacterium]|jgi:hypothetical protein|nr:hypothetical protein [Chloroflexota bacterium]